MIRLTDLPVYPELNACSPVRVNLVRTLELAGTERVLEIGADSAAITSYFAENCGNVSVYCLSETETELQKQVCAEQGNVSLIKETEICSKAPYDLITIIGTTEQAADLCRRLFRSDAETISFTGILEKKLLSSCGRILLADYRESLCSFDLSQFVNVQAFSVKPGYRFPMEMKAVRFETGLQQAIADAEAVSDADSAADSSGLLICLSNRKQAFGMPENIYTKFSNERRPECAVYTEILEISDKEQNMSDIRAEKKRTVRKYPVTSEAESHIQRIGKVSEKLREQYRDTGIGINRCTVKDQSAKDQAAKDQSAKAEYIEFEYLTGENCAQEVDRLLQTEGADAAIHAVCDYIRKIIPEEKCVPFHFVPAFAELFGNRAHEASWRRTLPVTNIDCILENTVMTETGYQMIDCEWTTEIPVPVEFLSWRIVHYYLDGNPAAEILDQAGIYEKCGLTGNLDVYLDMENQFQKWIEGDVIPLHKYISEAKADPADKNKIPAGTFPSQPEQLTTLQKIKKHGTYLLGHGYQGYRHMLQTRPNRPFDENYDSWIWNRLAERESNQACKLKPVYNSDQNRNSEEIIITGITPRFGIILLRGRFDSRLYAASRASVERQNYKYYKTYTGTVLRKLIAQAERECDYLVFLPAGYCLTPDALQYFASAIIQAAPYLLYADEDRITIDGGKAFDPVFKPDFSIDYLQSYNYIGLCFCIRSRAANDFLLNKLQTGDGFFYDLLLHSAELQGAGSEDEICHIPEMLIRKISKQGKTSAQLRQETNTRKLELEVLKEHYRRCGISAEVTEDQAFPVFRISYHLPEEPLVSIIVPNKDHVEELRACIESFENLSTYNNYEWIIVENNSTEAETFAYYRELEQRNRQQEQNSQSGLTEQHEQHKRNVTVVTYEDTFNYSKINNFGVRYAKGEFLLLLNNDTELISPDGLRQLVGTLQQEDAGIAGARLLYPDRRLQHGGIGLGIGGIAGHLFTDLEENDPGYGYRAVSTVDYSAVTAACLLVKKSVYEAVGGMEESLAVAFNDVDFCLKVRALGKRVVYCGDVELYHKESRSRGLEDTQEKVDRFYSEIIWFIEKWRDEICAGDPYYNRNLSMENNPFYRLR